MKLRLGVKSDPIEYRYSFPWLFRLMAEEGVTSLQLGSFFEIYQLPDAWFARLRQQAEEFGVTIDSVFTAHRELGGFFVDEPGWAYVALHNYKRLIEAGARLGAKSVGSNPGALWRDHLASKASGTARYIEAMKQLMRYARERGIEWLTMEPMSCLAEPPTLPEEIEAMARELQTAYEREPTTMARVGYCADIAHGYADAAGQCVFEPFALFRAALPWLYEVHLKNTDERFHSTFGFTEDVLPKGIIDVGKLRELLLSEADLIPVDELHCYLEIGGPKLGRDYSDGDLERQLRGSLRYLREHFIDAPATPRGGPNGHQPASSALDLRRHAARRVPPVTIAPSLMCADPLRLEEAVSGLETLGIDTLHLDVMDGHFVPNAPMGLGVVEALARRERHPRLDVHLMVADPDAFLGWMEGWALDSISVHAEACPHLDRTLERIRAMGARAIVALNPATPLHALDYVGERIDGILVMSVNPGFAGQKMTPSAIRKIRDARQWLDARDQGATNAFLQVDGNVSFAHIPEMVAAGADGLVAGTSSLFHPEGSWAENLDRLWAAVEKGWQRREESTPRAARQPSITL